MIVLFNAQCNNNLFTLFSMSDDHQEFTTFEAPSIEELNDLLNGYHFESFIAQGGMGAVYIARQTSLDREVAVKVLPREFGEDEEFRESFQSEAKLMAKLNHPNLIGIYDFGDIDGMLYIIMEFVKGNSLHHSAHGKAIQQETAVDIVSAVCSGLDHAHKAGILHRDIKPANILLSRGAVPKIGDFGLARPSGMTESGVIYGTPGYSAPEVLDAPEKVDNRTDVFAVGVMFYELLTGTLPDDEYVSVTEYTESDSRFDKIIQKATHPDITMRQSSAQEFANEINAVLKSPSARNKLLVAGGSSTGANTLASSPASGASEESCSKTSASAGVKHTASARFKLMRNIVIIFLLLGAIYAVLELKKVREAKVAEAQKIIDAKEEKIQKEKDAKKAAIALERKQRADARAARRVTQQPSNNDTSKGEGVDILPKDTSPRETVKLPPLEQLAKVKQLLSNGERPMSMMPDTIFMRDQDSRIVMYIDKKMTWDEADAWAAAHGGYIAVCRSKSDLTVFLKEIPVDAGDVWLGAGCSGDKGWCWVDDTPWTDTLSIKPTYNRSFAKISKYGSVSKTLGDENLNFFIEWRADGSNPAELEYRLLRASDTLTDINPKYPPGTITAGARNYCIIKRSKTFSEASDLALASGGHLVVISNDEEKYQVEGIISDYVELGRAIWTAAEKQNNIWTWQTGEKWQALTWAPTYPKGRKFVVIIAGPELVIQDMSSKARVDGFMIEWSQDQSRVEASGFNGENANLGEGLSSLKNKAKTFVAKQRAATEKKHAANVKKLWRDLETYMRGLPKNTRLAEQIVLDKIIVKVKDKRRIPAAVAGVGPSERSRNYTSYAVEKQTRIDVAHNEQIELLRTGYLKQLQKLKQDMEKKGQTSAVQVILKEVRAIGDNITDFEKHFQ